MVQTKKERIDEHDNKMREKKIRLNLHQAMMIKARAEDRRIARCEKCKDWKKENKGYIKFLSNRYAFKNSWGKRTTVELLNKKTRLLRQIVYMNELLEERGRAVKKCRTGGE